jgi:hypothetical protein
MPEKSGAMPSFERSDTEHSGSIDLLLAISCLGLDSCEDAIKLYNMRGTSTNIVVASVYGRLIKLVLSPLLSQRGWREGLMLLKVLAGLICLRTAVQHHVNRK